MPDNVCVCERDIARNSVEACVITRELCIYIMFDVLCD